MQRKMIRMIRMQEILAILDSGIFRFIMMIGEHKEFIIGTENSIVEHLQFECPDKKFYPVAVQLTCMNMKVTTLMDIYNCLKGQGEERHHPA